MIYFAMCIRIRDLYTVPVGISFQYSVQRLSNKRSNENPLFFFQTKIILEPSVIY